MGKVVEMRRRYGGRKLPYDAEVEYLESTGSQYIDTGIIPLITDYIYIEFYLLSPLSSVDGAGSVYGTMDSWRHGAYGLIYVPVKGRVFPLRGNHNPGNGILVNNKNQQDVWQSLTLDNTTFTGYGLTTIITDNPSDCLYSGYIFCSSVHGSAYGVDGRKRVRKFLHKRNGELIMDFIPVRVGTTGYMYDRVSGQLFGNSGTGEFILGPDVMGGVILELIRPFFGERRAA